MSDEKPKRFSGMKIKPSLGRKKKPDITYKDLVKFDGIPKPNMSQRQLKTFNKFIQVREGETHAAWARRTASRRVLNSEDEKYLNKSHPFIRRIKNKKQLEKEFLIIKKNVVDFDYLRYYAIVLNYYSIKYNMYREWLEVGFYFYEGTPFTRETFENVCVLSFCNSKNVFRHFIKKGWIVPVKKKNVTIKNTVKEVPTGLYVFHQHFTNKITYIYRVLAKTNQLPLVTPMSTSLAEESKKIIMKMNDEIMEIKIGKKPHEDILS